jgi:hypothetical protein
MDVGWGLFGDRMARGSGLSMIPVVSDFVGVNNEGGLCPIMCGHPIQR